jgi:hypothetical protein
MRVLTALLVSLFLVPITGLADNFTVGCPGGGAGTYPTITAALSAVRLSPDRTHAVSVSGTCTEIVDLTDFENVDLVGTSGATIMTPNPSPVQTVLVSFSKNITLRDLIIHGFGNRPVIQVSDSSVDIRGCTIEGGGDGVHASGSSRVNIVGSTIQDNQSRGVVAEDSSALVIGGPPPSHVIIQRNSIGVGVGPGSTLRIGGQTDVRDNSQYGVRIDGGSVEFSGQFGIGQRTIANSGVGLSARGGVVSMAGGGPILIQNNRDAGVSSWLGSSILLTNATVENNGSPTSLFPATGGVVVDVNSTAHLANVTISNSPVTGLVVLDNASVTLVGSAITGNGADGIRVETLSGVRFQGPPTTVTGNTGADLVCDSDTYVVVSGDSPLVGKEKCPGFKIKKK